jgi:hypothetical protein
MPGLPAVVVGKIRDRDSQVGGGGMNSQTVHNLDCTSFPSQCIGKFPPIERRI